MKFKLLIPICVVLVVATVVATMLMMSQDTMTINDEATATTTEETVAAISAENPLEGDKYPEINALVEKYLTALADGDVDTIAAITNNMTDIERIRVAELGKCIDGFPQYNVFTKIGPTEGSFIVYAAARAQFPGVDELVPGIYCFYVCQDEQRGYYFNEGVLSEDEQIYIDAINADASVVNLMDSIDQEYQLLVEENDKVRNYIEVMQNEIRDAVGTALASAAAETTETNDVPVPEDPTLLHTACQAITTETINVRSSDSETADRLGRIARGTTVDIIEIRVNGWAKITYEGKDAYLKTDYLQVLEAPEEAGTGENVANGTVVANETVNVRSDASTTASRMGQVREGDTLDWIADLDNGWSKIIYNGKVGYIKSEFLDKQ